MSFKSNGVQVRGVDQTPIRKISEIRLLCFLLFLILFFNHVDAALTWQGTFIAPSFPTFVVSALSLVLLHNKIQFARFSLLLKSAILAISLSLVLSLFYGHSMNRFLSGMMLIYSFVIGYSLLLLLRCIGKRHARSTITFFFAFLVAGTALELYTPFSAISDAAREWLHGWAFVYDASLRDLRDFGAIRPKFFSSEPSKLALTFSIVIAAITLLHHRGNLFRSVALSFFLSSIAIFLCRSPVIVYGFAVSMFVLVMLQLKDFEDKRALTLVSILTLLFILALPYLITYIFPYAIGDSNFSSGRSWLRRQVYPAEFAAYYIFSDPILLLFGAGYGGDDFLTVDMTQYLYLQGFFFQYPDLKGLSSMHLTTNAFYFWLVQMGLLGTFLFLFLLRRFFRKERLGPFSVIVLATCFIWQTFGTISAPMAWVPAFFLAWVISELFSGRTTIQREGGHSSRLLRRSNQARAREAAGNG